ncbi:regulatory protein RecX [Desulfuromonas sp. CSMB_57]|uniref:regulatory protein RecX n=1 Tax=Desulfuromonas sp. CSMB_57 TaxID=2807629 RepID=UPI001CD327AF|nr:regulatory protein RecX [Desulfuromonas sp. CSMB_57]
MANPPKTNNRPTRQVKGAPAGAWEQALRLLAVRDRSEAELAGRLRRQRHSEADILAALERCREYGYLDDRRFARQRARQLLNDGRAVGAALLADLRNRQVEEAVAREVLEELQDEFDPRELLRQICRRRFPGFDFQTADERQRRRVFQYLARRGFAPALLYQYFQEER